MRSAFKITGWFEGTSLLLLFFYAMPLKYLAGDPSQVRLIGSIHGGLFMAYLVLAFVLYDRENWTRQKLLMALVLSSVPFGTWIFERKYLGQDLPS
jgi:integral membrane protein